MSDFDRNYAATRGVGTGRAVAIDEGLRAYMIRVYNYMAMGVALTGIVSWLTFQAAVVTNASGAITGLTPFGQAIFGGPAVIVLFLATFGLVLFISFRIHRLQPATALGLFMVYAGLLGLMLSSVFLAIRARRSHPDRADQTLEPEPLKLGLIPIISPVCAHGPQCSWPPPLYLTPIRQLWPI